MIVAIGLISLLLLSMDRVLRAGTRYFLHTTTLTEMQQSCVVAAHTLVGELLEGNTASIRTDPDKLSVTFGSARDQNAQMTFDTASAEGAELEWYKLVGYYVDDHNGEPALFRKQEPLDQPQINPPPIPLTHDFNYWRDEELPRKMVATRVYQVDVVPSTSVHVIIGVRSKDLLFRVFLETKLKTRN